MKSRKPCCSQHMWPFDINIGGVYDPRTDAKAQKKLKNSN